jgi:hypothetical protein
MAKLPYDKFKNERGKMVEARKPGKWVVKCNGKNLIRDSGHLFGGQNHGLPKKLDIKGQCFIHNLSTIVHLNFPMELWRILLEGLHGSLLIGQSFMDVKAHEVLHALCKMIWPARYTWNV